MELQIAKKKKNDDDDELPVSCVLVDTNNQIVVQEILLISGE
jgi:hypothetical protein